MMVSCLPFGELIVALGRRGNAGRRQANSQSQADNSPYERMIYSHVLFSWPPNVPRLQSADYGSFHSVISRSRNSHCRYCTRCARLHLYALRWRAWYRCRADASRRCHQLGDARQSPHNGTMPMQHSHRHSCQNDPKTVPSIRTATSAMMQLTITVITMSR